MAMAAPPKPRPARTSRDELVHMNHKQHPNTYMVSTFLLDPTVTPTPYSRHEEEKDETINLTLQSIICNNNIT
jgi:hypothetical protein